MSLMNALMKFKEEQRLSSFSMQGTKKASIWLQNGSSLLVYMADEYIIGEAAVMEAAAEPAAAYLIYNTWDRVVRSALESARRLNIEVHSFGAFGKKLDELNGGS
jgi:predicted proteasome-type protease